MLVTSILSFSYNVFYSLPNKFQFFNQNYFCNLVKPTKIFCVLGHFHISGQNHQNPCVPPLSSNLIICLSSNPCVPPPSSNLKICLSSNPCVPPLSSNLMIRLSSNLMICLSSNLMIWLTFNPMCHLTFDLRPLAW